MRALRLAVAPAQPFVGAAFRGVAALVGLLAGLCTANSACAHDPPEIHRVFFRDDDGLLMLTNRGIMVGSLRTRSYQLMCNEAVGINTSEKPDLALLPDGRMLLASSAGLLRSRDGGCSWDGVSGFATALAPALAQDPGDPNTLYVAIFLKGQGGVYVTHDAGDNFDRLLELPDNDFVQELLVAPGDAAVLYASGEEIASGGKFTHYVRRSPDRGKTWQRADVPVLEREADVVLLAASPRDSQALLAATIARNSPRDPARLLVSADGGASFNPVLETETILDAAFGSDGDTAWVGSTLGLWRSSDRARSFTMVPGTQVLVSCVEERDGALWACGYYGSGRDGLSSSADFGATFSTRFDFSEVVAPLACDRSSHTAITCGSLWTDWQREILSMSPSGTMTAGTSAVAGSGAMPAAAGSGSGAAGAALSAPATSAAKATGCATIALGHDPSGLGLVFFAIASLLMRARRAKPRPVSPARPARASWSAPESLKSGRPAGAERRWQGTALRPRACRIRRPE